MQQDPVESFSKLAGGSLTLTENLAKNLNKIKAFLLTWQVQRFVAMLLHCNKFDNIPSHRQAGGFQCGRILPCMPSAAGCRLCREAASCSGCAPCLKQGKPRGKAGACREGLHLRRACCGQHGTAWRFREASTTASCHCGLPLAAGDFQSRGNAGLSRRGKI